MAAGTTASSTPYRDFAVNYIYTCIAATAAETCLYPLDITKTRLQIQGSKESANLHRGTTADAKNVIKHRGMVGTAYSIASEEGVLNLWQGLTPAVLRHCIYSGIRICVYETMRDYGFSRNNDGSLALWKGVLAGGIGGAVGQFCASPTDLVKVQMQMEGKRRLSGLPPRFRGLFHAFSTIYSQGGIRGLWKGWVPNCQRAAFANMTDMPVYDKSKRVLLERTSLQDNVFTHTMAAAIAGLASTIACTPPDVLKSRIMNQPTDANGRGLLYRSSTDCLMQTVRNEGFFALYKGFLPAWARIAPWVLIFWVSFEQVRRLGGMSSF